MINIQWTKFERKSIVTFISEELPLASMVIFGALGLHMHIKTKVAKYIVIFRFYSFLALQ